jgi:hypothetical protein
MEGTFYMRSCISRKFGPHQEKDAFLAEGRVKPTIVPRNRIVVVGDALALMY